MDVRRWFIFILVLGILTAFSGCIDSPEHRLVRDRQTNYTNPRDAIASSLDPEQRETLSVKKMERFQGNIVGGSGEVYRYEYTYKPKSQFGVTEGGFVEQDLADFNPYRYNPALPNIYWIPRMENASAVRSYVKSNLSLLILGLPSGQNVSGISEGPTSVNVSEGNLTELGLMLRYDGQVIFASRDFTRAPHPALHIAGVMGIVVMEAGQWLPGGNRSQEPLEQSKQFEQAKQVILHPATLANLSQRLLGVIKPLEATNVRDRYGAVSFDLRDPYGGPAIRIYHVSALVNGTVTESIYLGGDGAVYLPQTIYRD